MVIKLTNEEIILAKFNQTDLVISGYLKEAEGNRSINRDYTGCAVYDRIKKIYDTFKNDVLKLSRELD